MFEWLQKLTKSEDDRILGGICGGLGEHSEAPSWVWRILMVLFVLFSGGVGLLLYVLLWIFMPGPGKGDDEQVQSPPAEPPTGQS